MDGLIIEIAGRLIANTAPLIAKAIMRIAFPARPIAIAVPIIAIPVRQNRIPFPEIELSELKIEITG